MACHLISDQLLRRESHASGQHLAIDLLCADLMMERQRCHDADARAASSKLRQPTQYASPPCKSRPLSALNSSVVKFRSISDMSDDGSDSDSSVFPLRRCLATSSFSPTSSTRKKRLQFPTMSPKANKRLMAEESAAMEATIHEQRLRLVELEGELARVQTKNDALEAAAVSARHQQDAALRHAQDQLASLREALRTEQDKRRREMLQKSAEVDELRRVNEGLRQEIRACHASMTEWQDQAKQAEVHTRRLWQERLEMEYELVRSAAKCNQESAMAQRAEELKALQGLRSVSQSVFKEEEGDGCDDDDGTTNQQDADLMEAEGSLQRRRRRRSSSTREPDDTKSCWMNVWIDRQMQRHRDGLKWLDTIEHHLEEDAVEYGGALDKTVDVPTYTEFANDRLLDEIETLLRRNESIEDAYPMCSITSNTVAVMC